MDDPRTFGEIAAANALSDVYAMGARVLFALSIAAFPEDLPREVMTEIFAGASAKVREAGARSRAATRSATRSPSTGWLSSARRTRIACIARAVPARATGSC